MNLEEFSYQFGVNGAENLISKLNQIESETEELDNAVEHLENTFQKFFDYALRSTIPPSFIKMVMDQAMAFSKQAEYIDRLSQTSGISARTIQQFGYALHKFGGDVSTATSQLDHLQTQFEKFKKPINKGGGLASELAQLAKLHKVDLRGVTDSVDLLKAISVRMEKLSERKKINLARAFGLDDSTFLMVKDGLKNLEESLYKAQKFVLFDDKEIRQAKEFENTLRDIADNITLISKSFSFGAIPEMQKFANIMRKVTEFMTEHKQVVKGIGLTAFGAGAYGIFRMLNFLPTRFLKAAAGVLGTGLGIGVVNESVDKINRGYKDKTLIGTLEKVGWKDSARYLELIYRSIYDLTNNKSFEGLKNFAEAVGKDLGIPFLRKENIEKTQKDSEEVLDEYKAAFRDSGTKGIIARMMSTGKTPEERVDQYLKKKEEIDASGGVLSFLWKKLETIFTELKSTITSKDFWTPIFDKVNSLFTYLKNIFYDLVIFVKQKAGIELSSSDKAHLLRKQLQSKEQESIDKVIKAKSKDITKIMTSNDDLGVKKEKIQKRVSELSDQISKVHGNSGYSKESIAAKLLFEGSRGAFKKQNPDLINNLDSWGSYIKNLGLETLVTKDKILKLYDEYKNKKQQNIFNAGDVLKTTIDISDIIGDKKIDNVDVKNISLQDFMNKAFPLLSQDQTGKALARYKSVLPEDTLLNALTLKEQTPSLEDIKKGGFFSTISDWINNLMHPISNILQPLLVKRLKYHQNRLKKIKEEDTENQDVDYGLLQKDVDKLSFTEMIKEEINAELQDIYRNYISLDLAIERIGKLIDESASLITEINKGIKKIKNKIDEFAQNFLQYIGMIIGASLGSIAGPKGMIIGGLLGSIWGDKKFKGIGKDNYSWLDYGKDKLRDVANYIKKVFSEMSSKEDKINDLSKAQAIIDGKKNLEDLGNIATNSNTSVSNDNSQYNNITINQNININKTNASDEDIKVSIKGGTNEGIQQGLLEATKYRAVGNNN